MLKRTLSAPVMPKEEPGPGDGPAVPGGKGMVQMMVSGGKWGLKSDGMFASFNCFKSRETFGQATVKLALRRETNHLFQTFAQEFQICRV